MARPPASELPVGAGALRESGLRAPDDPTVEGAWLFPEALEELRGWGAEPGGGVRGVVSGVRVVAMADGSMAAAADRLPATPSSVVHVPDRLGGGFVFALGARLWRARTWLAPAKPFASSPAAVADVLVGPDRIYARSPQGALFAFEPHTGARIALGPLPSSPHVGRLAALDAWRAVAVADLRGALVTLDAGSTWRPLSLPLDPSDVVSLSRSIAVGGLDEGHQVAWWEVQLDGTANRLLAPPSSGLSGSPMDAWPRPTSSERPAERSRAFGPRPLTAAVEDGWPLVDGTALVARDGALARIRLADGALVESVGDAFPLKPARCHAVSLARTGDGGALGFICGKPRGATVVYRWDPRRARMIELRRFEEPREALAFDNGALAVRGGCATDEGEAPSAGVQPWCLMRSDATWSEAQFGARERVVVLADGRVALVHPPDAGDLSTIRLTLIAGVDGENRSELTVKLPPMSDDAARALRHGVWTDGFQERRPDVLGGWIDSAGALLGIEIGCDGSARVGEFIRDAGAPVASGRWAFGWTASRRGFETTDGGMTWAKDMVLPDPLASSRSIHERACGPVGCVVAGWLRIGWGASQQPLAPEPAPTSPLPDARPRPLNLECDARSGALRPAPQSEPAAPVLASGSRATSADGRGAPRALGVYSGSTWGAVAEFPGFQGRPGPSIPIDQLGYFFEASNGLERALRGIPLAAIYTWGPKSGGWDPLGRWQVRWNWIWGGAAEARSSATTDSLWKSLEAARRALNRAGGSPTLWSLATGDDADHALLVARHTMSPTSADVVILESDRPPVTITRDGGEPFPDVEGAVRAGGRWYLATMQTPGDLPATVIWSLDGRIVREMVRFPRAGFEARPALRLARHTDGHAIGLIVDGQPDDSRGVSLRWVAAIDMESARVSTPQPLAPVDLGDRPVGVCSGDETGWQVDAPYPGIIQLEQGQRWRGALEAPVARLRISPDKACVERLFGSSRGLELGAVASGGWGSLPSGASHPVEASGAIDVTVLSGTRRGLRCVAR